MIDPPGHLSEAARASWREIVTARPWLRESDCFVVECAAMLRAAGDGRSAEVEALLSAPADWRPALTVVK
jgi:hypothetical protein